MSTPPLASRRNGGAQSCSNDCGRNRRFFDPGRGAAVLTQSGPSSVRRARGTTQLYNRSGDQRRRAEVERVQL